METEFEAQVKRQIERLKRSPYRRIEAEVAEKRVAWFVQNAGSLPPNPTPRAAYELLFFDYMGLPEDSLPVAAETETSITWLSRNACPTLDACQTLGLDTRQVCRGAYEKSTQAFLSQIDPQLRFVRSYEEIRPYAEYCKESIVRVDFEARMRVAIGAACLSRQEGNQGYGAVIVLGDRVLAQAHDTAVTGHDPSLHAEVNAIRQAVGTLGDGNLSGAILFSTCEPCPMCASLAVWANLSAIVYGISIQETAALGKARILIGAEEVVAKSPVRMEVIGGVLKEECRRLYA